ncbi:MAG: rhodanese-like domain-containing protein [Verrucomicrobiales bacterium]
MKRFLVMTIALIGCVIGAELVSIEQAEVLMKNKGQILDVRTAREWESGWVKGAHRIDVRAEDFVAQVSKELDLKKPLLVYCHSGGRSARAAEQLESMGFKEVYDLRGGITAWKEAGKEVVK